MFKKFLLLTVILSAPFIVQADFTTGEQYFKEGSYSAAFNAFLPEADRGDNRSQYYIGYLYYYGFGVSQNFSKALEYLTASANKNNSNAQSLLGYMYDRGEGVTMDKKKAIEYYKKAVEQQDASAMVNLSLAYYNGDGVPMDVSKAIELLSQVPTDKTRPYVGRYLGEFYINSQDDNKTESAKSYLMQSARLNDYPSFYLLGQIYEQENDLDRAVAYYTYAAANNYAPAQYVLASMYLSGTGVSRSLTTAHAWLEMAANQQYAPAKESLENLGRSMTLSQVEKARVEFNRIQREVIQQVESPVEVERRRREEEIANKVEQEPYIIRRR